MCGIAGSKYKDKAFKLYNDNLARGYYSSGALTLDSNGEYHTHKALGVFNESIDCFNPPGIETYARYFLYHSRGPTVETKEFEPINNHPFFYGDWIVAHNGIISNFESLCKEYFPNEDFTGRTDSCIIPRMLEIKPTISEAVEQLKGTFAFWAFNSKHKKTYLIRSASTLFANQITGCFSSTEFEDSKPLEEGIIYAIQDYDCIVPAGKFKHNSPYFIL
jgi:glucosamine 6-phosphate synthetase-like amidotransferase/phosphosugar isomerase protein